MHYEINISLNGKHFFATHKRSITTEKELKKVLTILIDKFPVNEGFLITVTYYPEIGHFIDIGSILDKT